MPLLKAMRLTAKEVSHFCKLPCNMALKVNNKKILLATVITMGIVYAPSYASMYYICYHYAMGYIK